MQHSLPSFDLTQQFLARPRRNAVDISASTTSTTKAAPVSLKFGRRNAIDYTSSLVKSDWWHTGQSHALMPRHDYGSNPVVPFCSAEKVRAGVAMTELDVCQDLAHPASLITCFLPKSWMPRQPFVELVINWPGYNHLRISKRLFFFTSSGIPRTLMEVAHDIADIYRTFIHEYHADFDSTEHGAVRMGPNHVTFGHLRLLGMQLCSIPSSGECEYWIADVSFVRC